MLLIPFPRALAALGIECKSPSGKGEDSTLEALSLLTTRVENLLNVGSLLFGSYTDTFRVPAKEEQRFPFRLTNAFLQANSAVTVSGLYKSDGITVAAAELVSLDKGLVWVEPYYATSGGLVSITYQSGFSIPADDEDKEDVHPNPQFRVGSNVPLWLQEAVVQQLIRWRRNTLNSPSVTKEYGFLPSLNESNLRTIKGSIYDRYMRDRSNVIWPVAHTRNGN
jgi:hypothetical protein